MSGKSRFVAQFGGGGGGGGLTELEVGVTPIVNGTAGRLLIEGTANVLSQSPDLFWDFANDRLGIRTDSPECTLDIRSSGTSNTRGVQVSHYDNTTAFSQAKFIGRRARGTQTSPTAVLQNDSLASFNGRGRKATAWSDTVGGFYIYANQNWTDAATGTYMTFRGVNDGGTTVSEWMRISQGNVAIGTTATIGQRLRVRASSNLSTELALVIENTDNTPLLSVANDGKVNFSTWGQTSFNTQKTIRLSATQGQSLQVTPDSIINASALAGEFQMVYVSPNINLPASSLGSVTALSIDGGFNFGAGATGIVRGIRVNQSFLAYSNYRAIETSNNSGYSFYGAGTADAYFGGNIGVNQTTPTALLNVKGVNDAASTTSFFVENSSGQIVLRGRNNGAVDFSFWGDSTFNSVKSIGLSNIFGQQLDIVSHGSNTNTTLGSVNVRVQSSFAPTSGTATYTNLLFNSTINQTGGANGIVRAIYIDNTLTSAANYRAIETSNNTGYSFYGDGTANAYYGGRVGIRRTTAGATLDVQAEGALSTDVAFRVRNSADSVDIIAIQGNNQVVKGASTIIVPNVQSVTSAATVTPVSGNDTVVITAQAEALTLANPTGTWVQGLPLMIRIKDNGTSRAITYGNKYRAIGVTLPPSTTATKTTYLGVIYNSTDDTFDVIGVSTQA